MKFAFVFILLTLSALLTACGGDQAANEDGNSPQVTAVERYITAKAASDRDTMQTLICDDLEASLDAEAMSFSGIETSVSDMACTYDEAAGEVACTGEIVAVYDGENTGFPLGRYNVVEEDGVWKWCGVAD